MIEKFHIQNYKSCVDTKVDFHPQLTVMIGVNGAGKSNILNAVKIFSSIDRVRPMFFDPSEDEIEDRSIPEY